MKRSDMDMIAQDMVCIAERADGKGKVEGYYFCLHHNDGRKHLHHLIIPLEADLSRGTQLDQIQVEVVPESITLKAQEPRVMTLEEALAKNNTSIEISPYVFVEIKGRNDIFIGSVHDDIYGDYHSDDIRITVYRIWMTGSRTYPKAEYMKTVRFWDRKPTDKQREAVKWE